jgi:hypothetical protein
VQFAAFTLLGFGFYTLHASIQVQATELSPERARRRDVDAFVLLLRRACERPGAVRARLRQARFRAHDSLAALIIMAVGFVCARLLRGEGRGLASSCPIVDAFDRVAR